MWIWPETRKDGREGLGSARPILGGKIRVSRKLRFYKLGFELKEFVSGEGEGREGHARVFT